MPDTIKLGIIGAGAITQVAHLPVLRKLKGVEIVAICDPDKPKARALADRFQVRDTFEDIAELLEFEQLDAVAICTPNHLHEPHAMAALAAGAHVLVERPLALTGKGAERVIKEAAKRGRQLMVGMNHRYRSDVQLVRSFLQNKELGRTGEYSRQLAHLPAQPGPAGVAPAAGRGGWRCHARPGPRHHRPRHVAGGLPRARTGQRHPARRRRGPAAWSNPAVRSFTVPAG